MHPRGVSGIHPTLQFHNQPVVSLPVAMIMLEDYIGGAFSNALAIISSLSAIGAGGGEPEKDIFPGLLFEKTSKTWQIPGSWPQSCPRSLILSYEQLCKGDLPRVPVKMVESLIGVT
jgi:hypothetical protein